MANDDPSIGVDTIALEFEKKFGVRHSPTTINKSMREATRGGHDGRKSQTWATFLKNQASAIGCCDFFVVHIIGLCARVIAIPILNGLHYDYRRAA